MNPGLSIRAAADWVRRHAPHDWHEPAAALPADAVAADFATRYAGIPATPFPRPEPAVCYRVDGHAMPALLGMYGCPDRVRAWLPGLSGTTSPSTADALLRAACPPVTVRAPACQRRVSTLAALPVLCATPRDAGPYLTMGLVCARDTVTGEVALSVHRMLVLDDRRLAIWMVPGRALRRMHEAAVRAGDRLAVSVNVGAPPAALVASALSTAVLPAGTGKLALAGAMAGAPVAVAAGVSQPAPVLAESEVVLEGYLDDTVTDESLAGPPGVSLPEFLGYDGEARAGLPVLTVTAVTTRDAPRYQAVIGPGREQSVVLGLAGAVSVALTGPQAHRRLVADLHFSPAGGGMLLLAVAVRKSSADDDRALGPLARRIFERHRFVKLIVFTDPDVDIASAEDVLWAVTTRANLGVDCTTLPGFTPLPMDPSQGAGWERGGGTGRTFVDATTPHALRGAVVRSFDLSR
jgi:4-hydroxy-3-polyprenylbenzoate decarboxylase